MVTKLGNGQGLEVFGPIYVLNTSGTRVTVIDENGNIDAPITSTDLTTTGSTILGNGGGTNTFNDPNTFNATIAVGADDTGYDVTFFGATSGKKFFWDESADTAFLTCTVDVDGTVTVGVDDTGYDVKFFGATTGKSWLWDESADKMIVTGASDLLGNTQQTGTLTVGVDGTGHDVTFYSATASNSWLWDESADKVVQTFNSASTDGGTSVEPYTITSTMTGIGGVGGRFKSQLNTNVALGAWSNAIKGEVVYGATGKTTGLGSAVLAEITLSAGTADGTYAPFEAELNLGAGALTGTATSLMYLSVNQTGGNTAFDDSGFLMNIAGLTAAATDCFRTGLTAATINAATTAALRIKVGADTYYIPLATATS